MATIARFLRLVCNCECMTCALGQHCGWCVSDNRRLGAALHRPRRAGRGLLLALLLAVLGLAMAGSSGHIPPDEYCCHGAARWSCSYCYALATGALDDDEGGEE